jgi:mannose-6-phosphate isomerase-like protein (cupin superfamily)
VYTLDSRKTEREFLGIFHRHQSLHIKREEWHQLCNAGSEPLKIVEIQYGENCIEEDIERK